MKFEECLEKYKDTLGEPAEVMRKLNSCLDAWMWTADLGYEPRSGFYLYGATWAEIPVASAQPVSVHEINTATIAIVLLSFFPRLLPKEKHLPLILALLFHDHGERITKDIAANGSEKHRNKYIEEDKAIDQFFALLGNNWAEVLGGDWTEITETIKHKDSSSTLSEEEWNKRFGCNYRMARFLQMADKIEALLSACYLEQHGQSGSLKFYASYAKDDGPTERDFEAAERTNSDTILDIWEYSTMKYAKFRVGQDFDVLFEGLLRLSTQRTRGEDLAWLDDELERLGQ